MKFTVITPSFNQGAHIQRMIDSVRDQATIHQVEHIVLDNCSTDETSAHLRSYGDDPGLVNLVLIIERDEGQTAAINRGLAMSRGDILCWLNTDEWYHPGALTAVAEAFKSNPDVDVFFGDCDYVRAGAVVHRRREWFFSASMLLHYGCFMPSCSTFVRRRIVDDGLFLDASLTTVMDFDWYLAIATGGYKIRHIPESLASFTWHDNNVSTRLSLRRKSERRMVQARYASPKSPVLIQSAVLLVMRWWWILVRNSLRVLRPRKG